MQESNLDVNLIIQAFQEKVSQLTTDLVLKEATIKQLSAVILQLQNHTHEEDFTLDTKKKDK